MVNEDENFVKVSKGMLHLVPL